MLQEKKEKKTTTLDSFAKNRRRKKTTPVKIPVSIFCKPAQKPLKKYWGRSFEVVLFTKKLRKHSANLQVSTLSGGKKSRLFINNEEA